MTNFRTLKRSAKALRLLFQDDYLRGVAKAKPKYPPTMVKVTSLPKSSAGLSLRRPSRYKAGIPEMNTLDKPPAAVAAVCTILFSRGPKSPPSSGKDSGSDLAKTLIAEKPTMAPNKLAVNVHPVLRPRYRLEALTSAPQTIPMTCSTRYNS